MSDNFHELIERSSEAIQAMMAAAISISDSANRIGTSLAHRTEEVMQMNALEEESRRLEMIRIANRAADDFNQLSGLLYREGERLTFNVARCVDALMRAQSVQDGDEEQGIVREGMVELLPIAQLFHDLATKLGQIQNLLSSIALVSDLQADAQRRATEIIEHQRGQIRSAADMIAAACSE